MTRTKALIDGYGGTCYADLQYSGCPPLSDQCSVGFARALKPLLCPSWLVASDLWSINEANAVFEF